MFLIQVWTFFIVSLRCSFNFLIWKAATFCMSFSPFPQLLHNLRTHLLPDTHHLVKSVCFQQLLASCVMSFLKVLHYENMLNSDHICHLSLHSCPLTVYLTAHSSSITSVVDQEYTSRDTCSAHLSPQILSLAPLSISGLWPVEHRRIMILWQMFLLHACSR